MGVLAWALHQRWEKAQQSPQRIVWATQQATRVVGGVAGSLRQLPQLNHDLCVTEALLEFGVGDGAYRWLGEDAYRKYWPKSRGEKVADAVVMDREETLVRVIEIGGRYSRRRLEAFHNYWAVNRRISYEIW